MIECKKTVTLVTLVALMVTGVGVSCGGGGNKKETQKTAKQQTTQSTQAMTTQKAQFKPDPEKGKQLFLQVCAACHGPDAKGLPHLGKDLTTSKFVASKTDKELLDFVKVGRSPSDPLNTTGVAMPPKGGNPALSDEDILNIISYIRTLQKQNQ